MSTEDQTFAERMTARNGIRSVSVDGMIVTADSVSDEIMLDKYQREVTGQDAAGTGAAFGIRMRVQDPPGGGGR